MGEIKKPEWFQKHYEVDEVRYVDELEAILAAINPACIFRNYGLCTDSDNFAHPGKEWVQGRQIPCLKL
jgi:hypothetical protein